MRRTMLIMRLFATLGLTLWLVGSVSFQVTAQGNETGSEETVEEGSGNGTGNGTGNATGEPTEEPVETQEEEPQEEAEEPVATGTLAVLVYVCTTGGDAGTGAVFPDGAFVPDESCTEGSASIAIDGGEATEVAGAGEFTLDAGTHSVADTTTGAALDVEVVADGVTTVSVVAYAAPPEEEEAELAETPEAQAPTTIHLVKHDCVPSIQTADDFALLDAVTKLTTCPVITLPENAGTEGAVAGDPAAFDFSFVVGEDEPQTLANATFDNSAICEVDLGQDVDGDGEQLTCFDASSYTVTVPAGAVTVTETAPDQHRLGAVELSADDTAGLSSVDTDNGQFVVDPADDGEFVVHVYNFSPPRVSVVVHVCAYPIEDGTDFAALADFAAKLAACPAITLTDHVGPSSAVNGGQDTFDVAVVDADSVEQTIAAATFVENQVCESDLGADLDGDDTVDTCLSGYAYDAVARGLVSLTETPPANHKFGAVEIDPNSNDPAPEVKKGVVTLDTSNDGEVTVHLFNFAVPDSGGDGNETGGGGDTGGNDTGGNNTGGNTGGNETDGNTTSGNTGGGDDDDDDDQGSNTGGGGNNTGGDGSDNGQEGENSGGYGAIEIYNLYCLADSEYIDIEVLEPGQEVDPYSFGDDTCLQDGNEFQITEHSRDDLDPFDVGYDGYEYLDGVPSTAGQDSHLITETWTGTTVPFEVEADTVTEIVVLIFEYDDSYYEDEEDDYYEDEEDEDYEDEEDIEDGEGLPETGAAMMPPGSDRDLLLLLCLAGSAALGGAYRLRRYGGG